MRHTEEQGQICTQIKSLLNCCRAKRAKLHAPADSATQPSHVIFCVIVLFDSPRKSGNASRLVHLTRMRELMKNKLTHLPACARVKKYPNCEHEQFH